MTDEQLSKRDLLKKAAYVAPAILTLKAVPSFASNGSSLTEQEREKEKTKGNNGVGNGLDPQPPGNPQQELKSHSLSNLRSDELEGFSNR